MKTEISYFNLNQKECQELNQVRDKSVTNERGSNFDATLTIPAKFAITSKGKTVE